MAPLLEQGVCLSAVPGGRKMVLSVAALVECVVVVRWQLHLNITAGWSSWDTDAPQYNAARASTWLLFVAVFAVKSVFADARLRHRPDMC